MPDLLPLLWVVAQVVGVFTAAYLLLVVCAELFVAWLEKWDSL